MIGECTNDWSYVHTIIKIYLKKIKNVKLFLGIAAKSLQKYSKTQLKQKTYLQRH